MYLEHFGLKEHPFKITPDLGFFYYQPSRNGALKSLKYAVDRGDGIIKVVGDVGTGKTTLLRLLIESLPDSFTHLVLLSPNLSPKDLLYFICNELGLSFLSKDSKQQIRNQIEAYLLNQTAQGQNFLLVVDEAQLLSFDTLEELRLLSNLENDKRKLLQLILFGQIEFDQTLRAPSAKPFVSRISYEIYLNPFNLQDVLDYINHRFHIAGFASPHFFKLKDAKKIHELSGGIPRKINQICDKLLFSAFTAGRKKILKIDYKQFNHQQFSFLLPAILIVLMMIIVGFIYMLLKEGQKTQIIQKEPLSLPLPVEKMAQMPTAQKTHKQLLGIKSIHKKFESISLSSLHTVQKIPKYFSTLLLFEGSEDAFLKLIKQKPILNHFFDLRNAFLILKNHQCLVFYGYSNDKEISSLFLKTHPEFRSWPLGKVVSLRYIDAIIQAPK